MTLAAVAKASQEKARALLAKTAVAALAENLHCWQHEQSMEIRASVRNIVREEVISTLPLSPRRRSLLLHACHANGAAALMLQLVASHYLPWRPLSPQHEMCSQQRAHVVALVFLALEGELLSRSE